MEAGIVEELIENLHFFYRTKTSKLFDDSSRLASEKTRNNDFLLGM